MLTIKENKNMDIKLDNYISSVVNDFICWKNELYSEIRGGILMYDIKGYYKWLNESELLTYYMDFIKL